MHVPIVSSVSPSARVRAWLEHRWATGVIVGVTLVLALPSLPAGFFADDYVLRDSLHGRTPFRPPWYDLYWFAPGTIDGNRVAEAHGQFAWWTAPAIKIHLFRPLASALLALDDRLFGDAKSARVPTSLYGLNCAETPPFRHAPLAALATLPRTTRQTSTPAPAESPAEAPASAPAPGAAPAAAAAVGASHP
jgi:hypothetical protein